MEKWFAVKFYVSKMNNLHQTKLRWKLDAITITNLKLSTKSCKMFNHTRALLKVHIHIHT